MLQAGDRLRDLTLVRCSSESGAADVWLAKDGDGHRVVVRVLRAARNKSEEEEERLDREFEAQLVRARRVNHPGLVRVLGGGVEHGHRFVVVEYVDGIDLASVLARAEKTGRWPSPETSAAIVARVARAVAAIHQQIATNHQPQEHLSIAPSKILIDRSGVVKLVDFACAPVTQVEIRTTRIKTETDVLALCTLLSKLLGGREGGLMDAARGATSAAELAEALENAVAGHPDARPERIAELIPSDLVTSAEHVAAPPAPASEADAFFDPQRDAPSAIGKRFEILGRIGEGGMGEVYRARDRELNELVALKILSRSLTGDGEQVERMRREVRLARKISSPRVCRIYDLVELEDGTRGVAMELIKGRPLSHLIWEGMPLDYKRFAGWGADIAEGLAAAHALGIVHRDLKPDNIMIGTEDQAVILDFGVAYTADWQPSDKRLTAAGVILGTLPYMAPEQLTAASLDGRADLYALGLILAELVTGEVPFSGSRYEEVLNRRVIKPETFRLRDRDGAVPEALDQLVTELLAPVRSDRPASAIVVGEKLRAISRGEALTLPAAPAPVSVPVTAKLEAAMAPAEPPSLAPVFMLLGVIAALLIGFIIWNAMPKQPAPEAHVAVIDEKPDPPPTETSTRSTRTDAGTVAIDPSGKQKAKTKKPLPNAEEM